MISPYISLTRRLVFIALFALTCNGLQAAPQKKIRIDITTHLGDVKDYRAGDQVSFLLSLDADAYVVVVYQNAGGDIIQLLPNRRMKNYFYRAGLFLRLPDAEAAYAFTIQAPFGRETLWAFAADAPLPEPAGKYLDNGLKKLTGNLTSIRKAVRARAGAAYGEASLVLRTRPHHQ